MHLLRLSRGLTPAVIQDVAFSACGTLLTVSSARGTTHIYRLTLPGEYHLHPVFPKELILKGQQEATGTTEDSMEHLKTQARVHLRFSSPASAYKGVLVQVQQVQVLQAQRRRTWRLPSRRRAADSRPKRPAWARWAGCATWASLMASSRGPPLPQQQSASTMAT